MLIAIIEDYDKKWSHLVMVDHNLKPRQSAFSPYHHMPQYFAIFRAEYLER